MRNLRLKFFTIILAVIVLVPLIVFAQACPTDRVCLKNPLAFIGVSTPGELVIKVLGAFSSIISAVAIGFLVFSSFKLVVAMGNEESIKNAKEGIKWSIGGLAIALLSFTVISSVGRFVSFTPDQIKLNQDQDVKNPILLPFDTKGGLGESASFIDVMNFIMVNLLGIMGFATTLMIIYYAFRYITAAGNEEALEQAKMGLKWSIFGLVVALLAFTIITVVRSYLLFGP